MNETEQFLINFYRFLSILKIVIQDIKNVEKENFQFNFFFFLFYLYFYFYFNQNKYYKHIKTKTNLMISRFQ